MQFYSRNPKAKSVIWHPRVFFCYRTSADALKAKAHWETEHRMLWPKDMAKREEKLDGVRLEPRARQIDLLSETRV